MIAKGLSKRRKVGECGKRIEQIGREEEDADRAVSLTQAPTLSLGEEKGFKKMKRAGDVAKRATSLLEEMEEESLSFTDLKALNALLQGFRPGPLISLAGCPSMGKSTLASDFARFSSAQGKQVAYFSLEMSADEAAKKMLSAQSAIRLEKLERGFIEDQEDIERLEEGIRALEALPIYLNDSLDLSLTEVRTKCRRLKARGPGAGGLRLPSAPFLAERKGKQAAGDFLLFKEPKDPFKGAFLPRGCPSPAKPLSRDEGGKGPPAFRPQGAGIH